MEPDSLSFLTPVTKLRVIRHSAFCKIPLPLCKPTMRQQEEEGNLHRLLFVSQTFSKISLYSISYRSTVSHFTKKREWHRLKRGVETVNSLCTYLFNTCKHKYKCTTATILMITAKTHPSQIERIRGLLMVSTASEVQELTLVCPVN